MGVRVPPPALNFKRNILNVQIDNLGPRHERVSIQISPADYADAFKKSLKDLSKKVQIKGFRPGHVPMGMVKKMYGDQALADELNKLVNKSIDEHLKDNNERLLGDPLPSTEDRVEIDHTKEQEYTFVYEIGLQPSFELGISSADHFTWYRIPASSAEVEQEIERLQKKYGNRDEVEEAADGDVVYVHLQELNEDGSAREEGLHVHSFFNFEMLTDTGKELFGTIAKGGAYNIADIFSVFKGERAQIARNVLQMQEPSEEIVEAIQPGFECKVDRIVRLIPAELNEAFFQSVSAEYGEVTDESALRERISGFIEQYNDNMTRVQLDNTLYKYLIEQTSIDLPDQFLEKWFINSRAADGEDEETFSQFMRRLKESLIFRKVQQEHQLEATQDEIIQAAVQHVRNSYGQLGEDFVRYIVESQLKERSFVESMHDRVMQEKFLDVIRSMISIDDQATTLEEYQSLQKETAYAE